MSTTFELCAERLTPCAMLASTHSRCNLQGPAASRQGGCCRIVLPYSPARRHRAATSIVISRESVAGPISTGTGAAGCAADSEFVNSRRRRTWTESSHHPPGARFAFRCDAADRSKGERGPMLTARRVNYARRILLMIM